jgi:pilus assembly protein Flp/PilA
MTILIRFLGEKSAATAIEYSLIAGGIALAIVIIVQGLGTTVNATFGSVQTALK